MRQQLFKNSGAVADVDHDKIGCARHKAKLHVAELFFQVSAPGIDNLFRFALIRPIGERGQGAGLGDAVDVERLSRFLQHVDQVARCDAITNPQAGQAVNF